MDGEAQMKKRSEQAGQNVSSREQQVASREASVASKEAAISARESKLKELEQKSKVRGSLVHNYLHIIS